MTHPGPPAPTRIQWAGSRHRTITGMVPGECSLRDAIIRLAHAHGARQGTGTLRNCVLSRTRFTTGGPARDGKAANYTWIRDFGASALPEGTFTFGQTPDGEPFVHCHAHIDADELTEPVGGHLFPPDCLVEDAFEVVIDSLPDITLVQRPDPETLHSVFEVEGDMIPGCQAMFLRVRPNEDVVTAVESACHQAGVSGGTVRPCIGSLNAPVLRLTDGRLQSMQSVGMEVLRFSGVIEDGRATLAATLVDENGTPSTGELVRGHAPVCVTAEMVIVTNTT